MSEPTSNPSTISLEQQRNQEWKSYNEGLRSRLKREDFTIIASDCNGTMVYHDLGAPFLSPTINLMISMPDFVKLAEDLSYFMAQPLIPMPPTENVSYTIAFLGDLQINSLHYSTFEEAEAAWERRKARIN